MPAAIVTPGVAQDAVEEPEPGGGPRRDCDAEGDHGGEEVDDEQHGDAVGGGSVEGVDEVELQVERGREEGGELGGERGARGEQAEGIGEEGEEEGEERPEGYEEGEERAGAGKEELERMLAGVWGGGGGGGELDVPAAATPCLRALSRGTRSCRRRLLRRRRAMLRRGAPSGASTVLHRTRWLSLGRVAIDARAAGRRCVGSGRCGDRGSRAQRPRRGRAACVRDRCKCCCCWGLAAPRAWVRRARAQSRGHVRVRVRGCEGEYVCVCMCGRERTVCWRWWSRCGRCPCAQHMQRPSRCIQSRSWSRSRRATRRRWRGRPERAPAGVGVAWPADS